MRRSQRGSVSVIMLAVVVVAMVLCVALAKLGARP